MREKIRLLISSFLAAFMILSCGGGGGSTDGNNAGSTDTTAPSVPAGLTAVAASSASISLNWTASTDDVGVTGYKIYRGGTQIDTATNNSYSDSGLSSSSTYTYNVCAYDTAGNTSAQSGAAGATTLAAGQTDTQAPTAPANLTATAVSSSQINLSWTASTDNVAVAGYEVWRGSTKIATVTTTSYSDTGRTASSSYTYTVKAFDGAVNISAASAPASATTPAAGGGGVSGSLRVRVTGNNSTRVQNATIVLGNSNGGMITYGTTDANGEYTFSNPPANATVTAAYSCVYSGNTYTNYSLPVLYDVNVAAVTVGVNDCNSNQTTALGTISVNATNSIGAATYWEIKISGSGYGSNDLSSSQTYTVYPSMLQSDGKLSVVVIAEDGSYNPVGYGAVLDQTFVNGMTVNINVNQTFSYVQYTLNNIPATVKSVGGELSMVRKDQGVYTSNWGLSSTSTTTTLSVPYIPGFGDTFQYYAGVGLDQNGNGYNDSSLWLGNFGIQASAPSNHTFDFSQMPAIPSNVTVSYATGTATPTFSWTGSDASADFVMIYGNGNASGGEWLNMDIIASPTRTSVIFPELPPVLASFRPATVTDLTVNNLVNSLVAGYNDYLTTVDQWQTAGTTTIPTGTSKQSGGSYSSSQSLAPRFNKASLSSSQTSGQLFGVQRLIGNRSAN